MRHNGKLVILWLKGSFIRSPGCASRFFLWCCGGNNAIVKYHLCRDCLRFYVVLSDDESERKKKLVSKRVQLVFSSYGTVRQKPYVNCHNNGREKRENYVTMGRWCDIKMMIPFAFLLRAHEANMCCSMESVWLWYAVILPFFLYKLMRSGVEAVHVELLKWYDVMPSSGVNIKPGNSSHSTHWRKPNVDWAAISTAMCEISPRLLIKIRALPHTSGSHPSRSRDRIMIARKRFAFNCVIFVNFFPYAKRESN